MSDPSIDKKTLSKLTTNEDDKKQQLFKKIIGNDIEGLRVMSVDKLDLNVFEPVEDLSFIDESITPLIFCAYYGKTEIAKLLLKNSMIDIDLHTSQNRQTPLIVACLGGNYEMVKFLLDSNAEVNKPNIFNQTPLIAIMNRLIEDSSGFENRCICFKIADILINHGADMNWILDKIRGYTLLHTLCSTALKMNKVQKQLNYDIIKFLIDRGANISQRTLEDSQPEQLAVKHCNSTAIIDLIAKRKEMIQQNTRKRTSSFMTLKKKDASFLRQNIQQKSGMGIFQDVFPEKVASSVREPNDWKQKLGCMSKKKK